MAQEREVDARLGTKAEDQYCLARKDKEGLAGLGLVLDERPPELGGSVVMWLARNELKVRTREGGIGLLAANAVQREFEKNRGRQNIVLKARQMGLTTWVAARFFLRTITRPGTLTLQVAHTRAAAEEIFRIVHRFYTWLPEPLRKEELKTSRANVRQLVFPKLDSQYRVESAADRNAGRGLTAQNLHCSELARWPGDPAETLAGLRATLTPGAELIFESTPNGVGGCFHEEWENAAETGLVRHFFPWWMEERYAGTAVDPACYTAEERELAEQAGLSPQQIGFRRQIRANFRKLARQEFAEDSQTCFQASGECYFEVEVIEARLKEVRDPTDTRYNGELEIWLPAVKDKEYVVAVDPAGGGCAGDYSAMEVVEVESGAQCAEFAAHVAGLELARKAAELAAEYNHAWLAVERNNHGSGVLAYLNSDCHYERVYEQGGQAGWLTNTNSRPRALANLAAAVADTPWNYQSRRFLSECRSFVRLPNGNIAAQPGAHDDRVMAMAIAQEVRKEMPGRRSL